MSVMIGPQSLRSAKDGVIQLRTVEIERTAIAHQAVQFGQFGQRPSADRRAMAIAVKMAIESAAMIRPRVGRGPST